MNGSWLQMNDRIKNSDELEFVIFCIENLAIRLETDAEHIGLDAALQKFYHSVTYKLMKDGISDMHCMSDDYLTEELQAEDIQKK